MERAEAAPLELQGSVVGSSIEPQKIAGQSREGREGSQPTTGCAKTTCRLPLRLGMWVAGSSHRQGERL